MKSKRQIQYTLRGVPSVLDRALREEQKRSGESLNRIALNALARGLGVSEGKTTFHDLDEIVGTWHEDPAFNSAVVAHAQIDSDLWK